MQEYVSEAIILAKLPSKQMDTRYSILTKRYGKMIAKATSSRKITSKLAGHMEPGMLSRVRMIEQHGVRLVDALKEDSLFSATLSDLHFLDRLLAEGESEPLVWDMLSANAFDWRKTLRILGWDPAEAVCSVCGRVPVVSFSSQSQDFFCERCSLRVPPWERISLDGVPLQGRANTPRV